MHRVRFLLVLLAALLATLASAGQYIITYSGGISFYTDGESYEYGDAGPLTREDPGWYSSDVLAYVNDGAVTITAVWSPSNPSDVHPAQVVIDMQCTAQYSVADDAGYADDGFGDPIMSGPYIEGDVSGLKYIPDFPYTAPIDHYIVLNDSSGTVSTSVSPIAFYNPYVGYDGYAIVAVKAIVIQPKSATVRVSIPAPDVPVKGLAFSTATNGQQASYNVQASVTDGNDNPFPDGATFSYVWTDSGPSASLSFAPANTQTASSMNLTTATTTSPMKGLPTCTVVVQSNGNTYAGTAACECVAIGGPITTSIKPPTQNATKTYQHDGNNNASPFYMTYYDYSHDPSKYTLSPLDQGTQGVKLTTLDQPPGTIVTWQLPPMTYSAAALTQVYSAGTPHFDPIGVDAEGPFQNAAPVVQFSFSGDGLSGTTVDDSASTKIQAASGQWIPLVYAFSAHEPGSLTGPPPAPDPTPVLSYRTPDPSATAWTDVADYTYVLLDTNMQPMPGVWVQERFVTPVPQNFAINNVHLVWVTQSLFQSSTDPGISFPPDPYDGYFNAPDTL